MPPTAIPPTDNNGVGHIPPTGQVGRDPTYNSPHLQDPTFIVLMGLDRRPNFQLITAV
jgi:hypothetical protein